MASVYDLKPRFQGLLRPAVRRLAAAGVTANQVTVAALILSAAAGGAVAASGGARWALLMLPAVLLVRMALNAVDGMLAREHGMASALGAVLNELGDVLSDAALYLPLALVPGVGATFVVIAVVLAVISEMSGVVAAQIGASRRYDGPMGKSDRALAFGCIALLLGLGVAPGRWAGYATAAICLLLVVTVVRRAHQALLEVR
jgi:CDP-diacylglycerol--glycerol-3-phosphate 3-phosphatidyltransferase